MTSARFQVILHLASEEAKRMLEGQCSVVSSSSRCAELQPDAARGCSFAATVCKMAVCPQVVGLGRQSEPGESDLSKLVLFAELLSKVLAKFITCCHSYFHCL